MGNREPEREREGARGRERDQQAAEHDGGQSYAAREATRELGWWGGSGNGACSDRAFPVEDGNFPERPLAKII